MKKKILGHSHNPRIAKGTYQVGVPMKAIDYGSGDSTAWQQGHVIVYPNGKKMALGFNNPKTWTAGQKISREELAATYRELYGGLPVEHPAPRRREAIEHTRRKLGL